MQFSIESGEFSAALGRAIRGSASGSALPILEHVLLRVEGQHVTLTCTDLQLAVDVTLPVEAAEPGEVTLPVKLLKALIDKLDGEVTISLDADSSLQAVTVEADGGGEFILYGLPAEDFPGFQRATSRQTLNVPAQELKTALQRVLFAVSADESRRVLTGVHLRWEGMLLMLVATDTHRIVVQFLPVEEAAQQEDIIIPGETARELVKLIGKQEGMVFVRFSAPEDSPPAPLAEGEESQTEAVSVPNLPCNAVAFELATVRLHSRVIEGQYPEHERVMPRVSSATITLDTAALLQTVERARLVARVESNKVRFAPDIAGSRLQVSAETDIGVTREHVKADCQGEPPEIAFNADYLCQALAAFDTDQVRACFNGSLSPMLLESEHQHGYTSIIMPMQLL